MKAIAPFPCPKTQNPETARNRVSATTFASQPKSELINPVLSSWAIGNSSESTTIHLLLINDKPVSKPDRPIKVQTPALSKAAKQLSAVWINLSKGKFSRFIFR